MLLVLEHCIDDQVYHICRYKAHKKERVNYEHRVIDFVFETRFLEESAQLENWKCQQEARYHLPWQAYEVNTYKVGFTGVCNYSERDNTS